MSDTAADGAAGSRAALAEVIDTQLWAHHDAQRAAKERGYLKSRLVHYGVAVPEIRAVVRDCLRDAAEAEAPLGHDETLVLALALWDRQWPPAASPGPAASSQPGPRVPSAHELPADPLPVHESPAHEPAAPELPADEPAVHELRSAAVMVLITGRDHLGVGDLLIIERLLRQARTWALVDPLAHDVVGPLVERVESAAAGTPATEADSILERWAVDDDFWMRRAALLAHLVPLRSGRGDFARFSRFADVMLEEKEFFIRKAIGWVLRDTAKKRPDLVIDWLLPRAHRASGVTLREATKPLPEGQREAILLSARSQQLPRQPL